MLVAILAICVGLLAIWLGPKLKQFSENQQKQYEEKKRKKEEEKKAK